jgi:hypothetical protein
MKQIGIRLPRSMRLPHPLPHPRTPVLLPSTHTLSAGPGATLCQPRNTLSKSPCTLGLLLALNVHSDSTPIQILHIPICPYLHCDDEVRDPSGGVGSTVRCAARTQPLGCCPLPGSLRFTFIRARFTVLAFACVRVRVRVCVCVWRAMWGTRFFAVVFLKRGGVIGVLARLEDEVKADTTGKYEHLCGVPKVSCTRECEPS